jgi:hypothetical protein
VAANSFLNRPVSTDVYGALNSLGHNLIGNGENGSGYASTDTVGRSASLIDPKLGPLQDNGGPTPTMAPLPGSPAIDAGGLSDSEWDQRGPGYRRLVNGTTDIGAYEVQDGDDAGPSANAHRLPEAAILERETPVGRPLALTPTPTDNSTPNVPSSRAVAAVDQVFASPRREQAMFLWSRPRHADAAAEAGSWILDLSLRELAEARRLSKE